jgi:hypothetical protein
MKGKEEVTFREKIGKNRKIKRSTRRRRRRRSKRKSFFST